jgi:putative redox protein
MPDDAPAATPGESVLVAETGLGRLQVVARTSSGSLLIDEPVRVGGLGSGPDPYELLASALGACTAMTLRLYAERKGLPLTRVQVSVRHHKASLEAKDRFERTISLEGPLDEEQRSRLLTMAERCPVHRTLERGADISTALKPSIAAEPTAGDTPEHMRDMEQACG